MRTSPTLCKISQSLAFAGLLAACGGGGGGANPPSGPTAPPTPPPTPASAFGSFQIDTAGQTESFAYDDAANTVFCTTDAGWASLWIRLAAESTANGENGPHIDIDLCNHSGGGDFGPKDPADTSCAAAKTFDIFWHAADGSVFSNTPAAANCSLSMEHNGSRLEGTFECLQLAAEAGPETVDVSSGSFECTES